jgi:energy-coupling factor transporter ATP-binding protein EcfA2
MKIQVRNRCSDANTYRAARVKSLFNAETGANFDLDADLDIERDGDWKIGVVVGPSGSGKTSIGRQFFHREDPQSAFFAPTWPSDQPIIDAIGPTADFNAVTAALASVGLGDVPAWLRPFHALSMGEQFRATLARLVIEAPMEAVVDEFTSVVDRQIARIGALAFAKAWRRGSGRVVLLTPHYDVLDWLEPDWVFDTGTKSFSRRSLRRPRIDLEIVQTDWRYWPLFAPHHYLKIGPMPAAICYVGMVDGEPVAHLGVGCKNKGLAVEARACRLVVMPEWQGAGVGMRFLNWICENQLCGGDGARLPYPATTCFHTSHPGLCAVLRRQTCWTQISAHLHGSHKGKSAESIRRTSRSKIVMGSGFGGHFRAVQGFRYIGERAGGASHVRS